MLGPVILLLLFADVADSLASTAHLQVADFGRNRANAEPVPLLGLLADGNCLGLPVGQAENKPFALCPCFCGGKGDLQFEAIDPIR